MSAYSGNLLNLWPLFQDNYGRRDWMLQHWLRHRQYKEALANKGVRIYTSDLSTEMSADFHYQHWLAHSQLDTALGTGQYQAVSLIDVQSIDNANDYEDWQTNNAFLHGTIEQALGIH